MAAVARLPLVRIAFLSALVMFIEMLLVRWVGTELRVFAYLQNGVLVAAFLGLGLGFRSARKPARLLPAVLVLLSVVFIVRDPLRWDIGEGVTQGLVAFQDSGIWYAAGGQVERPQYVRTALLFYSVAVSLALLAAIAYVFRPLGQWLGAWMDAHPRPIPAYTANILGSLLGIGLFVMATVAVTRPFSWLAVAGLGLAVCAVWSDDGRIARVFSVGIALALPLLVWAERGTTLWSPYQKLSIEPLVRARGPLGLDVRCGEIINVNNVGYQTMVNLDPLHMAAHPNLYPPGEVRTSHYILPYDLVGSREKVLVVGAGSGNDVAAALRAGAKQVQAVEIDPTIIEIGRSRHPNKPYASKQVSITVDDARAFFRRPSGPYDLVWFGLLDSHTTPSAYANVRLDHFVYTQESFADMKRLLNPSGVVVLLFAPQTEWIAGRLVGLLTRTFGEVPVAMYIKSSSPCLGWGGLLLIGGSPEAVSLVKARAAREPELSSLLIDMNRIPRDPYPTTDDWPYLYLPRPSLPRYHLLVAVACLGLGVFLRRSLFERGEPVDGAMLLLGMGFMLLEVAGVSRASLLYGTTWAVNAYVVGAIFAMILLANLVASRYQVPVTGWPTAGLLVGVIALAVMPATGIAALPPVLRVVVGGGFLALPVFFSGLIFVTAWAATKRKDLALGSNLLGSLLGGIASMLSMVVGFRSLMFLTLAVYLGALLLLQRGRVRAVDQA
jgi:spermidine synthase